MKVRIRKVGNSFGALFPIEELRKLGFKPGDVIDVQIDGSFKSRREDLESPKEETTQEVEVITPPEFKYDKPFPKKVFNTQWCEKHDTMMGSCGCS